MTELHERTPSPPTDFATIRLGMGILGFGAYSATLTFESPRYGSTVVRRIRFGDYAWEEWVKEMMAEIVQSLRGRFDMSQTRFAILKCEVHAPDVNQEQVLRVCSAEMRKLYSQ